MFHPDLFDENGNRYPQIYSSAVNPTNPELFYRQVFEYLEPIRREGLNNVDISAYLEKASCVDSAGRHEMDLRNIVRDLGNRENLPRDVEEHYDIVFVWDIEDLTVLTRSCLHEVPRLLPHMYKYTRLLWGLITRILMKTNVARNFFLEHREAINIEDEADEMKINGPDYSVLKHIYNGCGRSRNSILSQDLLEKCGASEYEKYLNTSAEKYQQIFHQRWKYVERCLKLVNKRSDESKIKKYANVVVTRDTLSLGISQVLVSGCSKYIPIENVYSRLYSSEQSVWDSSEASIWERIQKRFGDKCLLVHVTSRPEYLDRFYRPRWNIRANESFKYLYKALRDVLLKNEENGGNELVQNAERTSST